MIIATYVLRLQVSCFVHVLHMFCMHACGKHRHVFETNTNFVHYIHAYDEDMKEPYEEDMKEPYEGFTCVLGLGTILMKRTMTMKTKNTITSNRIVPQGQPRLCSFTRPVWVSTAVMFWSAWTVVFFNTCSSPDNTAGHYKRTSTGHNNTV